MEMPMIVDFSMQNQIGDYVPVKVRYAVGGVQVVRLSVELAKELREVMYSLAVGEYAQISKELDYAICNPGRSSK